MSRVTIKEIGRPAIGSGGSERATFAKEHGEKRVWVCPHGHSRSAELLVPHL